MALRKDRTSPDMLALVGNLYKRNKVHLVTPYYERFSGHDGF